MFAIAERTVYSLRSGKCRSIIFIRIVQIYKHNTVKFWITNEKMYNPITIYYGKSLCMIQFFSRSTCCNISTCPD